MKLSEKIWEDICKARRLEMANQIAVTAYSSSIIDVLFKSDYLPITISIITIVPFLILCFLTGCLP